MGEVTVTQQLMHPTERTSYPFLLFWLAGWTVGGVVAAGTLFWQLAGREVLSIFGGSLVHRVEALRVGISRAYRTSDIKEMRVLVASAHAVSSQANYFPPGFGTSAGSIAFDFGARTIRIAPGLDEAEARLLVRELALKLPRALATKS